MACAIRVTSDYSFTDLRMRGVTGVLRIADIGLFSMRKCGNQASFLRIADICSIFAEYGHFCKINISC